MKHAGCCFEGIGGFPPRDTIRSSRPCSHRTSLRLRPGSECSPTEREQFNDSSRSRRFVGSVLKLSAAKAGHAQLDKRRTESWHRLPKHPKAACFQESRLCIRKVWTAKLNRQQSICPGNELQAASGNPQIQTSSKTSSRNSFRIMDVDRELAPYIDWGMTVWGRLFPHLGVAARHAIT